MPCSVSSQATPSYTTSKRLRWSKLIRAKITAASVASASTTAPRLTRRFGLMTLQGRATARDKKPSATQCPLFGTCSFSQLLYIQQLTVAEDWTFPNHPISGRANTAFEKPEVPKIER